MRNYNHVNAPCQIGVTDMNENIRLDIARLEAKLDVLIQMISNKNAATDQEVFSEGSQSQLTISEAALLRRLTTKQHCVAQLLVKGWKNADIGELMGVSENTIKLHVSATGKKMDLKNRGSIAVAFRDICAKASSGEYEAASGGIPMNWADNARIGMDDPLAPLYAPQNK